jgi:glycosyltransferase involved in cell wall biosynthesis
MTGQPTADPGTGAVELTILMPCLDESETIVTCVQQARAFLDSAGVVGEVLIADNGSTDGSQELALAEGARVVNIHEKGYGAALIGGIAAARGTYVAMGDADDSYDFGTLGPFLDKLRAGDDLVMGNRFQGGIAPGAMPPLHRYLGNPVLSFLGRLFFRIPVGDFHCGLRAFRRDSIMNLHLRTSGMEFASEMVVKASLNELRLAEVPTTLRPDGRSRPPHLRSWRDGWRHLRFLMLYSPRWLFFYPGLVLALVGLLATVALLIGTVHIGSLGFDIGSLLFAMGFLIVGYQGVLFAVLARVYAFQEGFLPTNKRFSELQGRVNLENSILIGLGLLILGVVLSAASLFRWGDAGFGGLEPADSIRTAAPAVLGLVVGTQTMLFGAFLSLLRIRIVRPDPLSSPEVQPEDAGLLASRAEASD